MSAPEFGAARNEGAREFLAVMDRLGIDPAVSVDPRLAFVCACARDVCAFCPSKESCSAALQVSALSLRDIAAFCPNAERLSYLRNDCVVA